MRARAVCVLGLWLAACGGPGNSLEGSITDSFSLDFDRVQIRKQDTELVVEYLKDQGASTTKVCKIVVDTENLSLGKGAVLSGSVFLDRVQVSRVAASGGDFPPVQSGRLQFDDYDFKNGGKMSGELDVLFNNGRTLHANFEGVVEEVSTD